MKRLQPGDLVGVKTPKGTGYVQFVRHIQPYGALVRVLPGVYGSTPDLETLAELDERFWVFLPLRAIIARGLGTIVGATSVPHHAQRMPLMKTSNSLNRAWEAQEWWLWDGEAEWKVVRSDPRLRTASPKETWNATLLIDRLASDWSPGDDLRPPVGVDGSI